MYVNCRTHNEERRSIHVCNNDSSVFETVLALMQLLVAVELLLLSYYLFSTIVEDARCQIAKPIRYANNVHPITYSSDFLTAVRPAQKSLASSHFLEISRKWTNSHSIDAQKSAQSHISFFDQFCLFFFVSSFATLLGGK